MATKKPIGDARPKHPIPKRIRNVNMPPEIGGGQGYRGPGYQDARKRALYLAGYRSTITGLGAKDAKLTCDHINPYRAGGGLTPHTNEQTNLRITDQTNNKFVDFAEGAQEGKRRKKLRLRGL
jgi:hypothetical protein